MACFVVCLHPHANTHKHTHSHSSPPQHTSECSSARVQTLGYGRWVGGSNAVFHLAVVCHVRQVLLIDEEERCLVRPILRGGGVGSQVRDGGGRWNHLIQAHHAVAALWGLGRAIQARRHEAVLVLGPRDLKGGVKKR